MKRMALIVGLILLVVVLVFINRGISNTAKPDNDDDDSQQTASKSSSSKPTTPPGPTGPDMSSMLQPEMTVGDPARAKYKVTVGWVYDDTNQANIQTLVGALQVVRQAVAASNGALSAEIVDLDVPAGDLSPAAQSVTNLGVAVNGQPIGPAVNPGGPGLPPNVIGEALHTRLGPT